MAGKMYIALLLFAFSYVATATNKNVLFIMVDDLRPDLQAYVDRGIRTSNVSTTFVTPNLNALASESITFLNAYSNYPLCGPSRSSLLSGRYPDTIKVVQNSEEFRDANPDIVTLPGYFKSRGYATYGSGKIFHVDSTENDTGLSWDNHDRPLNPYQHLNEVWKTVTAAERAADPLVDDLIRDESLAYLDQFKVDIDNNVYDNFFLAVGFRKPHLPWVFPEEYLNDYPGDVELPQAIEREIPHDFPPIARDMCGELCNSDGVTLDCVDYVNNTMPDANTTEYRKAYFSTVTYIDDLIGDVLTRLSDNGFADNTIVFFMSDHGWSLGEHNHWCKKTLFEESLRIPMMMKVPGVTTGGFGYNTSKLVEAIDAYPTIVEAATGSDLTTCNPTDPLSENECGEGDSMYDLIADPDLSTWKTEVYSQVKRNGGSIQGAAANTMGYSVTDGSIRYNVYPKYRGYGPVWKNTHQKYDNLALSELYDLATDQFQLTNQIDPNGGNNGYGGEETDMYVKIKARFP